MSRSRGTRFALATAVAAVTLTPASASADSTFVPTAAGTYSWGTPANWDNNIVPTNVGDVANLNNAIAGAQTVTLDGGRTIGTLNLGSTANAITIAAGTGGSLTFDGPDSSASLVLGGTGANVLSAPVTLADLLVVTQNGTGTLNFSGAVGGPAGFSLTGAGLGVVTLSGTNTFAGDVSANGGVLRATNAAALGTGGLSLGGGTVQLAGDAATSFGRNTVVSANSTLTSDRVTAGAGVTHALGTLSIGSQTLTVTRGALATSGTGGVSFAATTLTGDATFAPAAGASATLGPVGGSFSLTQNGAGTTVLSAPSTYTGGTVITAGVLQVNDSNGLGTGGVSYGSGSVGRIAVAGGVTIPAANVISINPGITGTSGVGLVTSNGVGQAVINAPINVNFQAATGGTFSSSNTVGNELVLNGPINGVAGVGFNQRVGRVIYKGGGNATGVMNVSDTALVGATDGIPSGMSALLGGSGNATLDLGTLGFNQTLAGIQLGNSVAANAGTVGTINLGAQTLTLTGDLASASGTTTTTVKVSHAINATTGGISFGATPRNISVVDNQSPDEIVMTGGTIAGSGGLSKTGGGTLTLKGVTVTAPLTVSAGTLAPSPLNSSGTLTASALSVDGGGTLRFNLSATGGAGDFIQGGTVTSSGGKIVVNSVGGVLPTGVYPLIGYTGASPGTGNFAFVAPGHLAGSLIDSNNTISLNVTGNDTLKWTGTVNSTWDVGTTQNWKTNAGQVATAFLQGDDITFDDGGTNTTITGSATFNPYNVTFANTTAKPYTISSGVVIGGTTGVNKTGNGTVTLAGVNTYTGPTTISGGTISIAATTGIGGNVPGNSIALSGGGQLNYTPAAAAALNLGADRSIAVGAGGGVISYTATAAATTTIPGALSGSGPLTFRSTAAGNGTFSLSGTNAAYTGAISVESAGVGTTGLTIASQAASPGGGSITLNYGPLTAASANQTLTLTGVALPAAVGINLTSSASQRSQVVTTGTSSVNGPVTVAGSGVLAFNTSSGTMAINGPVSAAVAGFTGTFALRGSGASNFVNATVNLPTGVVTKTDSSTWTFTVPGSVWTNLNVASSGGVKIGVNNGLAVGGLLTIGQSDASASLFDMNGFNQQVNGLTWTAPSSGTNARGISNSVAATTSVLTINSANSYTYGGAAGGLISTAVAIVKDGAGVETFGGANTYTGTTTVLGGGLLVNGTHVGGGSYTVTGGRLGGTGSVTLASSATNQVLVQPGGILGPGGATAPGVLSITNATVGTGASSTLTLSGAATVAVRFSGTAAGSFDQVNVTGSVNLGTLANLSTTTGYAAGDADQFVIFRNDGTDAIVGRFATANGVPLVADVSGDFYAAQTPAGLIKVYYGADESGSLTGGNDIIVVVPEPAAVGLLATAGVGLLARRRRRAV